MRTLVIENSTSHGSLALVEDGKILVEKIHSSPRGRGTGWFLQLDEFAKERIDLLVVGTGPGSYNGLRSSIAAGWGFARARGIPVHGLSSLLGYSPDDYTVVGDARAGQWFFARVCRGDFVEGPFLLPAGSPLALHGHPLFGATSLDEVPSAEILAPRAALLARWLDRTGPAEPLYLKPPHITQPAPPSLRR